MKGDLLAVIDRIYAAVADSSDWDVVLRSVSEHLGARSGCILSTGDSSGRGNVDSFHGIDPEWITAYNQWYYAYDPSLTLFSTQPHRIHVDHVTGPRLADISGNARIFFNELMQPQQFRHTLHLGFNRLGGRATSIILQRSHYDGAFEDRAIDALGKLAPHLERALAVFTRLQEADRLHQGLAAVMDHTRFGVILLDARGRVCHVNNRAQRLLRSASALQYTREGLVARPGTANQALQALIGEALSPRYETPGSALRLNTRDGWPEMYLQVTRLSTPLDGQPQNTGSVRVAVWVSGHEPDKVCEATLAALYNLTTTESRTLALLVEGYTQTTIAQHRSVNLETIRTQVKALCRKLEVSRQADLIRVVLSGPAALIAGPFRTEER